MRDMNELDGKPLRAGEESPTNTGQEGEFDLADFDDDFDEDFAEINDDDLERDHQAPI